MAREAKQNACQEQVASYKFNFGRKRNVLLQRQKSNEDGEGQDVGYGLPVRLTLGGQRRSCLITRSGIESSNFRKQFPYPILLFLCGLVAQRGLKFPPGPGPVAFLIESQRQMQMKRGAVRLAGH